MVRNRETGTDSERRCETLQDTSRAREQEKESDDDGKSGWINLRQLQPLSSHRASPHLVSLQRYIDHHHASPCPHGGGRVIKKAMDFSDASRACQHSCCSCTLVRRAVVLSVQCRSFTSAAAAGAEAGAEAGANLEQCASICVLL